MRPVERLAVCHALAVGMLAAVFLCGCSRSAPPGPNSNHAADGIEQPASFAAVAEPTSAPAGEPGSLPQAPRQWSGRQDDFSAIASFSWAKDDGSIGLRTQTGDELVVSGDELCDDDRAYLKSIGVEYFPEQEFSGQVVGVLDADTMEIAEQDGTKHRVRLQGIDAPENRQPFGDRARTAVYDLAYHRTVRVRWRKKDPYERTLGHVYLDDLWLNEKIIQDGLAWHYQHFSSSAPLAGAETAARAAKLGLWAATDPIAPWEYRDEQRYLAEHSQPAAESSIEPIVSMPIDPGPDEAPYNPSKSNSPRSRTPPARATESFTDSVSEGLNEPPPEKTIQVRGYRRKDGKYVAPYKRKAPKNQKPKSDE